MDRNKFTAGIFLDLSKVFDTGDHSIIIAKRALDHEWFKNI